MTHLDYAAPPISDTATTAAEYRARIQVYVAASKWSRADLLAMIVAMGRGARVTHAAAVEYRALRDGITGQGFISQDLQAIVMGELRRAVKRLFLPTIGKNEPKGASRKRFLGSAHFRGAKMSEGLRTCETDPTYLHPSFSEAVMGFPIGWTELRHVETP